MRRAIRFLRSLTPQGVWVLAGVVLAVIIAAALLWDAWSARAVARLEARLSANQTSAAIASGADAAQTVGQTAAGEAATDTITRENDRAIRNAPGADAPVDPAVDAAGRASLCRRAAYRNRPECVQQPAAR